eukprot:1426647-Amphidinium_carterae.2
MGSQQQGGVATLIAHSWLKGWRAHAHVIVPGRALIVELHHPGHGRLAIANIHAERGEDCDASEVLRRTREALVNLHCISLSFGDFNFDAEYRDRISEAGVPVPLRGKPLQLAWTEEWTRFVYSGFSHKYVAGLSRIDQGYSNLSMASAQALGAHTSVIGRSTPPAQSDHWPIALTWHPHSSTEGSIPRWIQKQECFASILQELVSERLTDSSSWSYGWHTVRLAAEVATWKTREAIGRLPASCTEANTLAAAALRQWWLGDLQSCSAMVARAPHWRLVGVTGERLRDGLERLYKKCLDGIHHCRASHRF